MVMREGGFTVGERRMVLGGGQGPDEAVWCTLRDVMRRADAVCVRCLRDIVSVLWSRVVGGPYRVLFFELNRELPQVCGGVVGLRSYDRLLCVSSEWPRERYSAVWEARVMSVLSESFVPFGDDGLPAYGESILVGSPLACPVYRMGGLCYGTAWRADLQPAENPPARP